jgi:hypothetical protein
MPKFLKPLRMLVPFRRHYQLVVGQTQINTAFVEGWKPLSRTAVDTATSNYATVIMFKRKRWWED